MDQSAESANKGSPHEDPDGFSTVRRHITDSSSSGSVPSDSVPSDSTEWNPLEQYRSTSSTNTLSNNTSQSLNITQLYNPPTSGVHVNDDGKEQSTSVADKQISLSSICVGQSDATTASPSTILTVPVETHAVAKVESSGIKDDRITNSSGIKDDRITNNFGQTVHGVLKQDISRAIIHNNVSKYNHTDKLISDASGHIVKHLSFNNTDGDVDADIQNVSLGVSINYTIV